MRNAFAPLILFLALLPATVHAASFDCKKAKTEVEKMICTDAELSKLDEDLARAYRGALAKASDTTVFRNEQRAWQASREARCGARIECLRELYRERLVRLSGSQQGATLVRVKSEESAKNKACYRLFRGTRFAMCREFERNLNQYCDAPPMLCETQIAPAFRKNFSLPKWEALDPEANLAMIEKFLRARVPVRTDWIGKPEEQKWREKKWKEYEPGFLQRLKAGEIKFFRARFDLNHDGKQELVYRLIDRECPVDDPSRYHFPGNPQLMVMDEATGEFDPEYTKYLWDVYDVLLYQGRAHLTHFGSGDNRVNNALQIYDTVSGPGSGRFHIITRPVCGYEYLDQRGK
jgi:uncharacterized protein YecT (DUF1311 family)